MAFDVDLFGQSSAEKVISITVKRKATAQKMAFEFTPHDNHSQNIFTQ
jgi:hypothetical protein